MKLIGLLLRIFSFVYHVPLALFLLGIGLFGLLDDAKNMQYAILPWTGKQLICWMLGIGAAGLITAGLAIVGKARMLFVLYALGILGLIANAFQTRYYGSMDEFKSMLWILFGALGALVGAISNARK